MGKDVELLTVHDHFDMMGSGLVLLPDFAVPDGWRARSDTVVVITPDGEQREFLAHFRIVHLKINDPKVDCQTRWRGSVSLLTASNRTVPIGSRVLCESQLKAALTSTSQSLRDIENEDVSNNG
ncbi:MAG TPA: hypothetical protein VFZ34_27210 [Blastocatellia bacterium]|nr:hypothetical protein [Blastocatellia bacterium]